MLTHKSVPMILIIGDLTPVRLAARREDRNDIRSCRQRQVVQVVTTVERASAGTSVSIGVDRSTQQTDGAGLAEHLRPAGATSRNKGFKTRRGAREVVRNAVAQLAATGNREAQYVFSIVVQQTEDRANRARADTQVATNAVDDDQRVVAIRAAANVVQSQHCRNQIVASKGSSEVQEGSH